MAKYICVGDIHGRYDLLSELLRLAESRYPDHRLIFLGDMVDRGPESFKVVDTIKKLTETKNAVALLGNHEGMMFDYVNKGRTNPEHIWIYNGGKKTMDAYASATKLYGKPKFIQAIKKTHWNWFQTLPLYFETDEIWISHAPIPREVHWGNNWKTKGMTDFRKHRMTLTWSYHGDTMDDEGKFVYDHGKLAICGHVHALFDNIMSHRIYKGNGDYDKIVYADSGSGCHHEAPLSGVVIDDGKVSKVLEAWPKK